MNVMTLGGYNPNQPNLGVTSPGIPNNGLAYDQTHDGSGNALTNINGNFINMNDPNAVNQAMGNNSNSIFGNMGGAGGPPANSMFGSLGQGNALSGGAGAGGAGLSIPGLIQNYIGQQQSDDALNTQHYNDASSYLKGIPGQYNSNPTTKATQGLVQKFLANPNVLSPQLQQQMRNQTDNQIQAQTDNGLTNTNNILAASGDNDSSTMAAASQAANRNAIGQMGNANTNLGIQAAQLNNQSMQNAIGAGQRQSAQDTSVPMSVGQSIMSNLSTTKPDDPSGVIAMMLASQSQQNAQNMNNGLLRSPSTAGGATIGGGGGGSNVFGSFDPMANDKAKLMGYNN